MLRIKSIIYISNTIKNSLKVRTFSKSYVNYNEFLKPNLRTPSNKKDIGPLGWFLLVSFPIYFIKRNKTRNCFSWYQPLLLVWVLGKYSGKNGKKI